MKNIRKRNWPSRWVNAAIALCAGALLCLCVRTALVDSQAKAAEQEYASLQSLFETALAQAEDAGEVVAAQTGKPTASAKAAAERRAADEPAGQAAYEALTGAANGKSSVGGFDALREKAPGAVAWIKGAGTAVDYPVMQGGNNSYYQTHLYNGKRNGTGAIFMDAKNSASFADQNTVLYGHHMRNGSMFASLVNYQKQSYYRKHPTMTLYTPDGAYLVEFFAGYSLSAADADMEALQFSFASDASFEDFVASARKKSTFKSDVEVKGDDKVLTLCTCTYEIYDGRYVLHGKLTRL